MASNLAHSLPPFAQAFSTHSLSSISTANNALPPIHARIAPDDLRVDLRNDDDSAPHSRKRSHQDISLSPGSSECVSLISSLLIPDQYSPVQACLPTYQARTGPVLAPTCRQTRCLPAVPRLLLLSPQETARHHQRRPPPPRH